MTVIPDPRSRGIAGHALAVMSRTEQAQPARIWTERDKIRLFPLFEHWHGLGPRSSFELLDELVGADPYLADDVETLLRRYATLDAVTVAALDGRELRLPLTVVAGDRR